MAKKSLLISGALYTSLVCVATTFAQAPVTNIDPHKHADLAAAQSYIVQAYQRLDAAQHANKNQLGDHAQRAKDLLAQADREIRQAANVSNAEGR